MGGGWGNTGGGAPTWERQQKRDREWSKARGCIIMRPGSGRVNPLHTRCAEEFCTPYNTMGMVCEDPDRCKKKHLPVYRFPEELKKLQLEHVKANRDKLCFNAKTTRWLKQEDKYLLGNANGPLRAGENRG